MQSTNGWSSHVCASYSKSANISLFSTHLYCVFTNCFIIASTSLCNIWFLSFTPAAMQLLDLRKAPSCFLCSSSNFRNHSGTLWLLRLSLFESSSLSLMLTFGGGANSNEAGVCSGGDAGSLGWLGGWLGLLWSVAYCDNGAFIVVFSSM